MRLAEPFRNAAKTHPPASHHPHLLNDCLLVWVGNELLALNRIAKAGESTKELSFGFLNLFNFTNPSGNSFTLEGGKSAQDCEDDRANSVVGVGALCSFNAAAQNVGSFYGEASYASVSAKDVSSDNLGTFKPTAARLTVGNVLVNNLAVEGFLLQGLSSDSNNYGGASIDVGLKTSYGIALRPFVNLTDAVELFGRLGSVRVKSKTTVSYNGQSQSSSDSTTNTLYGVGLAYKLTDTVKLVADYTKLSTKNEVKPSMISVGVRYAF